MTSLDEANKKKTIAVIGGGVTGIIMASVIQQDGHRVVVFEKSNKLGGVWVDAYPGVRLQNTWKQYYHPDFPFPEEPDDEHPTAPQLQRYFEQCAEHFALDIRMNTQVTQMEEEMGGWKVSYKSNTGSKQERFDFCIIATGQFTREGEKQSLPWPGIEDFEKQGGNVLVRRDMTDMGIVKDKKVAVIGFGKTAVDFCEFACSNDAQSVTHIFRNPRWMIPITVGGLDNSWLLFNRVNNETIPAWDYPNSVQRFMHNKFPFIFHAIWGLIQNVCWFIYSFPSWFQSPEIRDSFVLYKPQYHLLRDHRTAAAVCPPNFFQNVRSGKLVPIKGSIDKFAPRGILIDDGRMVEADIVFACIGNGNEPKSFPFLPQKCRSVLEKDERGFQLYRHLVHPELPNLAFPAHGALHTCHAYLASIWISCLLRGEMSLPYADAQLATIQHIAEWKKQHQNYEPNSYDSVNTRVTHYNDTLMMDLGLNPKRKSNPIAERFARYGPGDYAGVLQEIQAKRETGKFRLHPVAVSM